MSMEITGVIGQGGSHALLPGESNSQRMPTLSEQAVARTKHSISATEDTSVDLETLVSDLDRLTSAFDKRLKFSINRELGQVVVKVIDRQTDKVIKELPPREIQRLHVRLREAIGLLIDEEI